ncbi:MAG: hypothetical protein IT258_20335 [Saprospiraceae bacterium]|nr:hypothetical protein [Saprospiraceae bacterium]
MKFAKSLIASFFAVLLPLPFANACGISYIGEDYRVALLNPYVIGEEYSAFFYSSEWLNSTQNDTKGNDRKRNCEAWAKYAGNGPTVAEVRAVVYDANYDELMNAAAEGVDYQRFSGNSFYQFLSKKENKAAFDYLILAKAYEHFSALETTDPWADPWSSDSNAAMTEAERGKKSVQVKMAKQFKEVKDPFLKRRYAYQLLVMSRYNGEAERFEQLYAEHFRDDRSDALSAWATFHRAAIVEDSVEASYLLAQSFRDCPEKRIYCYQHFDKSLTDRALGFCKNDSEKAMVIALTALRNPGKAFQQIQQIQNLDANCPLLPLLLVRETNKLEDWLLTDDVTGMGTAYYPDLYTEEKWEWNNQQWVEFRKLNKETDRKYLATVREFVVGLASQKAVSQATDLMKLLAGHLYFLDKQGVQGEKFLKAIPVKTTVPIAEQQWTEQILLLLNTADISKPDVKAQLVALLEKLDKNKAKHQRGQRDFAALNLMLSQAYEKKGDLLTAFCLNNHALNLPTADRNGYGTAYYELIAFLDWKASEKNIDDILALKDKKDKTAFEQYLTTAPLPSHNALLDLRGTISFRKNDLQSAVSAFEKVEKDFWKTKYEFAYHLVSDPFTTATDTLHRGKFPVSKTAFVKHLIELENDAKAVPSKATNDYLLLGTAWLNCSYVGKSWMMFSYGNSVSENGDSEWFAYNFQPTSEEMKAVYYGASRAYEYLDKARASTKDKEVHARVDYLKAWHKSLNYSLTQAEQDEMYALEWDKQGSYLLDKEMAYFKDWAKTYKSTSYYKERASNCPVLVTYFGK